MVPNELVARVVGVARVLWGALTASQAMLLFVVFSVRPPSAHPPALPMVGALYAVGLVVAVASFVVPRLGYASGPRPEIVPANPAAIPAEPARFADPEGAARRAFALGQTALILAMALSEAVSLFGFVLGFLGAELAEFLPLFAAGLLLAVLRFPSAASLLGPYERRHGASFQ